jgi:hypothetical protein
MNRSFRILCSIVIAVPLLSEAQSHNEKVPVIQGGAGPCIASLHSFDASDGYAPAGLVQTSDTTLSGTTSWGGAKGVGVIFSLNLN